MKKSAITLLIFLITACGVNKTDKNKEELLCIQIVDRNGMSETISAKERLEPYQTLNFQDPQPYKQVLRIFSKDAEGKSRSKITSYHSNGNVWQYLEARDTRANGHFLEWHSNGKVKIEAYIVEGSADLSLAAQKDWIFDGLCKVWDEEGNLNADISYSMGALNGESKYYYPNGEISKIIPYVRDSVHGELCTYFENGELRLKTFYEKGEKTGPSLGFWQNQSPAYIESYERDRLITGIYWNESGEETCEVQKGSGTKSALSEDGSPIFVEIQNGQPEGKVTELTKEGELVREFHLKNGMKQGEEIFYYLDQERKAITPTGKPLPKLLLHWEQDSINGTVKTWYDTGKVESQKDIRQNKKNGMNCGWYEEGSVMFVEEYENDKILHASYFRQRESEPLSKIVNGAGIATLFDGKTGHFMRKVAYVNGIPQE